MTPMTPDVPAICAVRYAHIGFRVTKAQARALRYRAHSTVRQLAEERAQDRKYGRLLRDAIIAGRHRLRSRRRAHLLKEQQP